MLVGMYLLLVYIPWPGANMWLAGVPDIAFAPPPGPMALFGGFPEAWVIGGIETGVFALAILLVFGIGGAWTPILLSCLLIVDYGFLYSTGKVDHGGHLLMLMPFVLAWAPGFGSNPESTDRSGEGEKGETGVGQPSRTATGESWPLTMLALIVGFAMFTAGAEKLFWLWFDPGDQAILNFVRKNADFYGRFGLLTEFSRSLPVVVWELLDWVTVIFEVGFLIAVVSRRWLRRFCGAAVFFHAGVFLVLSISFVHQMIVYAAFLNWDAIARCPTIKRARRRIDKLGVTWWRGKSLAWIIVFAVCTCGTKYAIDIWVKGTKIGQDGLVSYILFATGMAIVGFAVFQSRGRSLHTSRER